MSDILEVIARQRWKDVRAARAVTPEASLAAQAATCFPAPPLPLRALLAAGAPIIAAEFKRASPSKGALCADVAAARAGPAAAAYARGGARLVSVLTEGGWFGGSLADLRAARAAAEAAAAAAGTPRPALLRKDFVVDAYQLSEARAHGADTCLLIVALRPRPQSDGVAHADAGADAGEAWLRALIDASRRLGMEPLVEVNGEAELRTALAAGARVLGVNNRDLRTFVVDLGTTARVVAAAAVWLAQRRRERGGGDAGGDGDDALAILSLSGLRAADDIAALVEDCVAATAAALSGCGGSATDARALVHTVLRGFLIGEALMRSAEPQAAVAAFVAAAAASFGGDCDGSSAAAAAAAHPLPPLVKICGVRDSSDALQAARAGADLIGMILVPGTARHVDAAGGAALARALRAFREQDASAALAALAPPRLAAAAPAAADAAALLRELAPRAAALRAAARRARPLLVGVCMDAPLSDALAAASAAGADVLQLHGAENPAELLAACAAAATPPPVVKVLHVRVRAGAAADAAAEAANEAAEADLLAAAVLAWAAAGAAAFILDTTAAAGAPAGGTGLAFDHARVLAALGRALDARTGGAAVDVPVILAGGLTPATVAEALASVRAAPHAAACRVRVAGVDVSSGVEVPGGPKGRKDGAAVAAFIAAARASEG